jgi:hypothetical protein
MSSLSSRDQQTLRGLLDQVAPADQAVAAGKSAAVSDP